MITVLRIEINGRELPMGRNKPRCINTVELESYRFELWADHCRKYHLAFSKEDAHNGVIFTYKEQ